MTQTTPTQLSLVPVTMNSQASDSPGVSKTPGKNRLPGVPLTPTQGHLRRVFGYEVDENGQVCLHYTSGLSYGLKHA